MEHPKQWDSLSQIMQTDNITDCANVSNPKAITGHAGCVSTMAVFASQLCMSFMAVIV